jgi:hypothetical protein
LDWNDSSLIWNGDVSGFQIFLELILTTLYSRRIRDILFVLLVSKKHFQMDAIVYDHQFNNVHSIFSDSMYCDERTFSGFSDAGWFVLLIQAVVCQLMVCYPLVMRLKKPNSSIVKFIRAVIHFDILCIKLSEEDYTRKSV